MSISEPNNLTKFFLEPANSTHRQYEALRAYYVEGLSSAEAAKRFGYTPGSFRVLCHEFRRNPQREFFQPPATGPQTSPKVDKVRQAVIALRKQNLSEYSTQFCHSVHAKAATYSSAMLTSDRSVATRVVNC